MQLAFARRLLIGMLVAGGTLSGCSSSEPPQPTQSEIQKQLEENKAATDSEDKAAAEELKKSTGTN